MMNVALISSWHVHAKGYAREIKEIPGASLSAVWDANPAIGKEWATELGCAYQPDFSALLRDSALDGIILTAPTNEHAAFLEQAALAGKHIFTEKVMTLTSAEARRVRAAVEQSGVVLTISFPHICEAPIRTARDILRSGVLGTVSYARVRKAHDGLRWLPDSFFDPVAAGGGAMMDLGAHPMYLLPWLLGQPDSVLSCYTNVADKAVEDNAVSVFSFPGGVIGVSETAFASAHNPFSLEISGTQGTLQFYDGVLRYRADATEGRWVEVTEFSPALPNPLELWVRAVTEDGENPLNLDLAEQLTIVMEAAYAAAESGKRIALAHCATA
ncbi:MAG: Gfo/Idh/MocA family oxidoreductase [Oscillospiraceae bacterium]|jgi:predicted dehydrogenase|nr:Gfo/Idh/MocA family oxidoreductase [Oscillospiraceae bacterium]